jgi:hypothetical protein
MTEHVAKVLCDAAGKSATGACSICREDRTCTLWRSFLDEATAAIGAVRDHAMLTQRKQARNTYRFTAQRWVT